jgi:hypothetical protein
VRSPQTARRLESRGATDDCCAGLFAEAWADGSSSGPLGKRPYGPLLVPNA